jgi:hypothetical protein
LGTRILPGAPRKVPGFYASPKPKELTYELSGKTIRVGQRAHGYSMFKSFDLDFLQHCGI